MAIAVLGSIWARTAAALPAWTSRAASSYGDGSRGRRGPACCGPAVLHDSDGGMLRRAPPPRRSARSGPRSATDAAWVRPALREGAEERREGCRAIAEASTRGTMRFVKLKSEAQIDAQILHPSRSRLVGQRTALITSCAPSASSAASWSPKGSRMDGTIKRKGTSGLHLG
jgi:hypothetical protein